MNCNAQDFYFLQPDARSPLEPARTGFNAACSVEKLIQDADGKLLWKTKPDHAATASPSIYRTKAGQEFMAVTATGGTLLGAPTGGDSLVAFALPQLAASIADRQLRHSLNWRLHSP